MKAHKFMDGTIIVFKLDCFFLFINEEQTKKKKNERHLRTTSVSIVLLYLLFTCNVGFFCVDSKLMSCSFAFLTDSPRQQQV